MADDDERLRLALEQRLEPEDSFDIEMVGRFVEQQDVRFRDQLPDAWPAASAIRRKASRCGCEDRRIRLCRVRSRSRAGLFVVVERSVIGERIEKNFLHRLAGTEDRILRHVTDAHALSNGAQSGSQASPVPPEFSAAWICRIRSARSGRRDRPRKA